MVSSSRQLASTDTSQLAELFQSIRARTMQIVAPLEIEDYVIQTAEFMSPPRWHVGHTSWFFETLLQTYQPGYKVLLGRLSLLLQLLLRRVWGAHRAGKTRHKIATDRKGNVCVSQTN